jgi:cell division septum initiation protein DivIVA
VPDQTAGTEDTNGSAESPLAGEGVGARVTAVFTAAEKAAEHIMSLAREEADDVRRRAHAEIDTYRQECRNTAEQEAQRIIQAAHDSAGLIERDARAAADELERAARERRNRLLEETHLIEERVEWAREGLREVVGRLEQVASPDGPEPEPQPEPS